MGKPHIVKFSGGRSSAMMLIQLLEDNKLDAKRGDVIVFNNTSAEHSATYDFVRSIKKLAEQKYNIPFFWIEYQTYEDASNSYSWIRKPSYRLVNHEPFSKENPNGYRFNGEVFEEMISFDGFLPNMMSRSCTLSMKIFVTNAFLSDWFAQKESIERLGHYGDYSKITDDDVVKRHIKNGGRVPKDTLLVKKKFVRDCKFVREEQFWKDYTLADIRINNANLKNSVFGDKAQMYGDYAAEYVSFLGIRSDEQRRIVKIKERINKAQSEKRKSVFSQPHGESISAPLIDNGITQKEVIEFWNKQDFNLNLPNNSMFSNCIYCPLKGRAKLQLIATMQQEINISKNNVESIDWWIDIEKKYSRRIEVEDKKSISEKAPKYIGFFGAITDFVFQDIKNKVERGDKVDQKLLDLDNSIPCNCTD